LGLTPSARADNFERFTVTGVLVNGNADTIGGGFIVDETTHQVASVNLFVVSDNLHQGTAELNLFGKAGVFPGIPNLLEFDTFDSMGDELTLGLVFPGNSGSFAGYTGGLICDALPGLGDPACGGAGSAFITFDSDGTPLIEDLRSGSIVDSGPLTPPRSTPETGTLGLATAGLVCLCMVRRRPRFH